MPALSRPLHLSMLPEDVLHEILAYLLTDTTDPTRANVLRVGRSIHEAADGLLYQHAQVRSLKSWQQLFSSGPDGLLTVEGGKDLARHVRQLTLGARNDDGWGRDQPSSFVIGEIRLDQCTRLIIDAAPLVLFRGIECFFAPLFKHLAPTVMSFTNVSDFSASEQIEQKILHIPLVLVFWIPRSLPPLAGLAHRHLQSLHFDGLPLVLSTFSSIRRPFNRRTLLPVLHDWIIDAVVIDLTSSSSEAFLAEWAGKVASVLGDILFGDSRGIEWAKEGTFSGWGRVELRVGREVEEMFRRRHGGILSGEATAVANKHLASLIVFVDEDGQERKLID